MLGSKVVNIQPTINRFSTDINGSAAKGDVGDHVTIDVSVFYTS